MVYSMQGIRVFGFDVLLRCGMPGQGVVRAQGRMRMRKPCGGVSRQRHNKHMLPLALVASGTLARLLLCPTQQLH